MAFLPGGGFPEGQVRAQAEAKEAEWERHRNRSRHGRPPKRPRRSGLLRRLVRAIRGGGD